MRKKIIGIILLLTSVLYSAAGGVFAREDYTAEVYNRIETGDINISLEQYNEKGEKFRDGYIWTPGDVITDVVQIENQARDCWIRVKAVYDEIISPEGISDRWVFREPYWYYTEILRENEKIIFSEQLAFSKDATEETEGRNDGMEIIAEAIQAVHYVPAFDTANPWGDEEAEICIHSKTVEEQDVIRVYRNLSLEMEGEAGKLIAAPEDFFSNLSQLMPGDRVSDEVRIFNTFNKKAELFFRTEDPWDMTPEQQELLENLELTIYNNEELIYKGDLRSKELNEEISLGVWKSGEQGILRFEISMPPELKNSFAVRDAAIRWIFRTNIKETSGPKTGDDIWNAAYLMMAILSGALGIWMLLQKKENNR